MPSTLEAFAEQDFAAGTRESATIDLADPGNGLRVRMDRAGLAALPEEHVADLELWVEDGGSWRFDRSWQIAGGVGSNPRTGEVVTHVEASGLYPWMRVRVRVRCLRALRTSVTVERIAVAEPSGPDDHRSVAHVAAVMWSTSGVTGATQSITIGSEADRSLYGFTGVDDNEGANPAATVTWNTSESLTELQYLSQNTGTSQDLHCYVNRRKNPTAATADLVWAGMQTAHRWVYGYVYAQGVDQTTPDGTPGTNSAATGDTHTGSCTGVADGLSYGFCAVLRTAGSGTITDGGGQTATAEVEAGPRVLGSVARISGSGTNSYSWTSTGGTTQAWIVIAVPLNPAAAAVSLEQEGFRFRDDDGDEDAASWLAAQDTDISRGKNTNTRLRVLANATGDPPSTKWKLQYRKTTDVPWKDVD